MDSKIKSIIKHFAIKGEINDIKEYGSGNINRTFLFTTDANREYILQHINSSVFVRPFVLMRNIDSVTKFCRTEILKAGGDPERETLTVIKTLDDKNLLHIDGEYYRIYNFIPNCVAFDNITSAKMFGSAGKAFGHFAKLLDQYPIEELDETIPNFHNSKIRYKTFLRDIKHDACGRVSEVLPEIEAIKTRFLDLARITDYMEVGEIPLRVTHNDTKINNVLFDKKTNNALCVIDLDTVMPGSILFDFGDAIRSGASTTPEDGDNPELNLNYFENFAREFLKETIDILTPQEIANLAFSCRALTLELVMRFLNDYINGNTYFRCEYENHNLKRARNQLCLLKDMESKYSKMESIIKNIVKELRKNS